MHYAEYCTVQWYCTCTRAVSTYYARTTVPVLCSATATDRRTMRLHAFLRIFSFMNDVSHLASRTQVESTNITSFYTEDLFFVPVVVVLVTHKQVFYKVLDLHCIHINSIKAIG
jgi:hypothetical protein